MTRNIVLFLSITVLSCQLFLSSCVTNLQEVVEYDPVDSLKVSYTIDAKTGLKEGVFEKFSEDGTLYERAHYQQGEINGSRTLFYPSGTVQIIEHYQAGIYHGEFQAFYENEQVELEGQYVENEMAGDWKRYYQSGALMEVVAFSENLENGPFTEYYENGALKAEGQYLDGDNEHGKLSLYNEQGKLIRIMECDKGICRTQWKIEDDASI